MRLFKALHLTPFSIILTGAGVILVLWMVFFHPVVPINIHQAQANPGIPTTSAVVINYNDNTTTVTVTFNEAIKTAGYATRNLDLSKLHLKNTVGTSELVTLTSNAILQTASSTKVTIVLTEAQRIILIQASAVAGGDAGEIVVTMDAAAAYSGGTDQANISGEPIVATAVTETADTNKPAITSATLNYNNSGDNNKQLVVLFSETVKSTSLSVAKFHPNNASATDLPLATGLTGASVGLATSTSLTITLTEAQRASLIAVSGVTGGDGGAVKLDVDALGIKDIGKNSNDADLNNTVTETPDTVQPAISTLVTASGKTYDVTTSETIVATFSETMVTGSLAINLTSNSGFNSTPVWSSGNTVATFSPTSSLPPGQAITLVIATAPDLAGNALSSTGTITLRVLSGGGTVSYLSLAAPVLSINNGEKATSTAVATLTLGASMKPDEMMVSSLSDFSGATWQAYKAQMSWTLSGLPGVKTIYAKYRNSNGESAAGSASIELLAASATPASTTPSQEQAPGETTTPAETTPAAQEQVSLVLGQDGHTVYLKSEDSLYAFRDKAEFLSHGYKFSDVAAGSEADWALPVAGVKQAAVDALIKVANDPTVWIVNTHDVLNGFSSLKQFLGLGYNLNAIQVVGSLEGYTQGTTLPSLD